MTESPHIAGHRIATDRTRSGREGEGESAPPQGAPLHGVRTRRYPSLPRCGPLYAGALTAAVCLLVSPVGQADPPPTTETEAPDTPIADEPGPPIPGGPPDEIAASAPPALGTLSGQDFERRIRRALQQLSGEPSLIQLERAALQYADASKASTRNWRRAAKSAAALPTLKVTADYGIGRDEALDRYQDEPDRWGADTDRAYGIDVSLQWKLDELVFNTDELKVYDALADRAARRESLLSVLIGYYYERRRLQLEGILVPSTDVREALDRHIRINELTAAIDALTGGLLSRKLGPSGEP